MLSFIDVRLMFIQPNIPIDYLPGGLVQCLEAKDRCIGYAFDFSKTDTQRVGSFWADVFNFRKKRSCRAGRSRRCSSSSTTCWCTRSATANRTSIAWKTRRTPLGPLQGAGEYFSDKLR